MAPHISRQSDFIILPRGINKDVYEEEMKLKRVDRQAACNGEYDAIFIEQYYPKGLNVDGKLMKSTVETGSNPGISFLFFFLNINSRSKHIRL